jgi:hypothetical protein
MPAQIGNRPVRTVGPDHEHAGRRVHGGDDLDRRRRAADPAQCFIRDFALHKPNIQLAGFEQGHVFGAALGVARLNRKAGVRLVDRRGGRFSVNRETAAWRRRAKHDNRVGFVGGGRRSYRHR